MRRLWIERQEAYAACLAKMKVYIEDHENGDTMINDLPCRKLGDVKNGQQKHFAISEDAAKVFVVADKASRNLYNEFVRIPAGREDVFLSGRNVLEPFAGNPFHFDGTADAEVVENRKQGSRRGARLMLAAVIVGILAGAIGGGMIGTAMILGDFQPAQLETYEVQGVRITLPDEFEKQAVAGYTACYSTADTAVFLLREDFSLMEGFADLSLEEYGAMVLSNNGFDQTVTLRQEEGLTVFDYEYTNPDSGDTFFYYTVITKGPDAFWMIQFSAPAKNAQEKIPTFQQWAKAVSFAD